MRSKSLFVFLAGVLAAAAILGYGIAIGTYKVFPYKQFRSAYNTYVTPRLAKSSQKIDVNPPLMTNLVSVERHVFNEDNPIDLVGSGGGLTSISGNVIGVDRVGKFFHYESGGRVSLLEIGLPNNIRSFEDFVSELDIGEEWRERHIRRYFRVVGIAGKQIDGVVNLFVAYNYWHGEEKSKSVRVSQLVLENFSEVLAGTVSVDESQWQVLLDSTPRISFSTKIGVNWEVPFNTNHSGGGMVVDHANNLIVGIADQNFDGNLNTNAPQDDTSSYGKIFSIDIDSHEIVQIAKGVRNPQGIFLDGQGEAWFTDQGPKGGDELNSLESGANYGWPLVTYGTDYNELEWPVSERQGRHDGFSGPKYAWVPSIGLSDGLFISGAPSQWDGDILVSSLRAKQFYRVRVVDGAVVVTEPIDAGKRVRDILQMDDGTILAWTDSEMFLELRPIEISEPTVDMIATLVPDLDDAESLREILSICSECHSMQPGEFDPNTLSLWNVFDREIASTGYLGYSSALQSTRGRWTEDNLAKFLGDTARFAPGTSMPSTGLDEHSLELVIDYLELLQTQVN